MTNVRPKCDRPAKRVLLVGWDGADWKMINPLLEQGLMPAMKRFTEAGVMGNIASLTPMLSPILWTSIATGKHADKHGILGFCEPDGTTGNVRPVTSTSRTCKAIWNILSDHGLRVGAVNWFASHPAEEVNGFIVTDRFPHPVGPPEKGWPAVPRSVHPEDLLDELCKLRVHPAHTTPVQVQPFITPVDDLDPLKEEKLIQLRMLLAHCATVHAAATHCMQSFEWDFCAVYYDAIDRFAHAFMEFHPPKMRHVSDRDFQIYREVMTGCYRFHDMMLARLMEIAGEDTTVIIVSDHGFHSDDLRPEGSAAIKDGRPVAWHRPYGIFAAHGPKIKKDERVYGASLLDVTPTILALLGLPVADDMDGQPLVQILDTGRSPSSPTLLPTREESSQIATYETDESRNATSVEDDPWVAQQMMQQLKDLGYVGKDADDTEGVALDRLRNLGQVFLATGRPRKAIEEFERALAMKPDENGAKMMIAQCRMALGDLDECERLAMEVLAADAEGPQANLYLGMICFRRGDAEKALQHLQRAEKKNPRLPGLHIEIGNVYLRRERWNDAEESFRRALEIDADNAEAHDGLGVALRNLGRPAEAVHEHMQSIGLLHHRAQTHIHLGLALAEVGRIDWAIRAFHVALEIAPDHPFPHRCLAQLYDRAKKDPKQAEFHRQRAGELAQRIQGREAGKPQTLSGKP